MPRRALALAMLVAVGALPVPAAADPAPISHGETSTEGPVEAKSGAPAEAARFERSRYAWSRCAPDPTEGQCVRPRPARVLLVSLGAIAGGLAAAVLFALGDRLAPGDPATLMVGTGSLAGTGALLGMVLGRLGADDPARSDRVRPATGALAYGLGSPSQLDERSAHTMTLRLAPTWTFRDQRSRVRLVGHLGGLLAATKDVDPRPQFAMPIAGQQGTAPVTLRQRATSIGVGLDWAVRLPYPVLRRRRSAFLGPSEIRWKPDVQIRREVVDVGQSTERVVSRTMLLPLTVGVRWHVSARQRFTFYVGPRFDFLAFSRPGESTLSRGKAQLGPLYGEAWYDIDVPLTARARRDGRARRIDGNGQFSLGYTHSRFDGRGFNVGPVVGFLGPIHAQWHTRIRPVGSPVAWQMSAALVLGNGAAMTVSVGIAAPDLSRLARRRKGGQP